MNQEELREYLIAISGISDFCLELKPIYSKSYWGRYFPDRKLIRIYQLNDEEIPYDDAILLKEAIHELVHHIQRYHVPGWERKRGVMHDDMFYEIYKDLLDIAFDRDVEEAI